MRDYIEAELSAPKYVFGSFELRQILETGRWAMFRNYYDEDESLFWYIVNDDWGAGNIDDESLFTYRALNILEELRYL